MLLVASSNMPVTPTLVPGTAGSLLPALDAGTIWQDIQGYVGAYWAAIAANNAGHCSTPAYGGTAAATTLCPSDFSNNFYDIPAAPARAPGWKSTKY